MSDPSYRSDSSYAPPAEDRRPLAVLAPGQFRARCGACDVWFDSEAAYDHHFLTDEHRVVSGSILTSAQRIQAELASILDDVRQVQLICAALTGRLISTMTALREEPHAP